LEGFVQNFFPLAEPNLDVQLHGCVGFEHVDLGAHLQPGRKHPQHDVAGCDCRAVLSHEIGGLDDEVQVVESVKGVLIAEHKSVELFVRQVGTLVAIDGFLPVAQQHVDV